MQSFCEKLSGAPLFQRFVLGLILLAGVLVGIETDKAIMDRFGGFLHALDRVILWLFVAELAVRIGAFGKRPWRFLADPWNVFDFVIVAVCLLPFHAQFAAVLRLARVLRVLRLITVLPRLQILVGALLKSIPSMSYVALLLSLLFYVYAVAGVTLFGANDPERFGSLAKAALTLFQIVTLEGWTDIMHTQIEKMGSPLLPIGFFISFILLGTMIILNLLIGVIVSGMDEARQEMEDEVRRKNVETSGETRVSDDIISLQRQLEEAQKALAAIQRRLK